MDNTSSHRIQHRLAVVDNEAPNFMGIRNGIYLSSNNGKSGNILFFEEGELKYKTRTGITTVSNKIVVGEHIVVGSNVLTTLPGSVIIGEGSCEAMTVGCDNVFIGRNVASGMMEGNDLVAIGANTLKDSSALGGSVAIGVGAMSNCGKTEMNVAIGKDAMTCINDAYNVAVGVEAGKELRGSLVNHNILIGRSSMAFATDNAIGCVAIGSHSCSNMSGNNFQSIYLGDKVAQRLTSEAISVNNIGMGTEALIDASDISDVICIGTSAGKQISGVRSVILGTKAADNIVGSLNDDILIGSSAGSQRKYTDSHVILIGWNSGVGGSGKETIAFGTNTAENMNGNHNTAIGSKAGDHLQGDENICIGSISGSSLKGSNNICLGLRAGQGVEGSRNVWIGEGPAMADVLNNSVVIGPQIFVKGSEAVVVGSQVGKSSVGFLNRDILIGANAGMGQRYNESVQENRGMLLIGANAGLGDPENPENVDSQDLVCVGHSAGHSNEQTFKKTIFMGNYAGSFAKNADECVVLGHSAGVGMDGEANVFIGPHTGFNVKGNRNILIGSHCGDQAGEIDAKLDQILAIGHSNRPTLFGDLGKGNMLIGSTNLKLRDWTDGQGTLGFVSTERPKVVSKNIGGVLYATGKHLEYATDKRITNLTFPYKITTTGEMNGAEYLLNTSSDGGTLLRLTGVPSTIGKANLFLSKEVMLFISGGECTLSAISGDGGSTSQGEWSFEIIDNERLKLTCKENVKGILYLEAIGVGVLRSY